MGITYNQFRSKFKGSGLNNNQISQLWGKYKKDEITDQDLTEINIKNLILVEKVEKGQKKMSKTTKLKEHVQYDMVFPFSYSEEDIKNSLEIVNDRLRPIIFTLASKAIENAEKDMTGEGNDFAGKMLIRESNRILKDYKYMNTSSLFRVLSILLAMHGIITPTWVQKKSG